MEELKQPEVDVAPFTATMAPGGVSDDVVARLVEASNTALNDPVVRKRIEDMGNVPANMSGAEFERFLDRQVESYRALIDSGLLSAN